MLFAFQGKIWFSIAMKKICLILCSFLSNSLAVSGAEYECPVSRKIDSERNYPDSNLQKYTPSVKIKENGDYATVSRCSFQPSANQVTCDDYNVDFIAQDKYVGHKKYYMFYNQFDVQLFADLSFIENNGRATISYGKCILTRP